MRLAGQGRLWVGYRVGRFGCGLLIARGIAAGSAASCATFSWKSQGQTVWRQSLLFVGLDLSKRFCFSFSFGFSGMLPACREPRRIATATAFGQVRTHQSGAPASSTLQEA